GDEQLLLLALLRRLVGVSLVGADNRRRLRPDDRVEGAVLGVAVGPAELLDHLPVAETLRARARLRDPLERLDDDVVVSADVLRLACWDARAVLEERRRLLQRRNVRSVAP